MSFDYISLFFLNLFGHLVSIVLFLGIFRFGDRILAFFKQR